MPAHFPPYVGSPLYRTLSRKRVAGMLRNCRRAAGLIQLELTDRSMQVANHGLYLDAARTIATVRRGGRAKNGRNNE